MDRLSALATRTLGTLGVLGALAVSACDPKPGKSGGELPPRPSGAKVNAAPAASTEAFCDLHATEDKALAFRWPELASGGAAPGSAKTWRWVNVWATWCKPCIEEMPRLAAWRDKLTAAGTPVELAFISVDDSDEEIAAFRKEHPETPPSVRIVSAEKRAAWLESFGLGDGAIPIQLFVSPGNRLRCARAAGIHDKDYDSVARLLTE